MTRSRLAGSRLAGALRADFHRLPFPDGSCGLIVAAFCLYHSPDPASVVAEVARCLTCDGTAVIAVKSADSYRELDRLMAASGLDPAAENRPSLYQAAHSRNITDLAATGLSVRQVVHETHHFIFPTLADAAGYLATSPKYDLPNTSPAPRTRSPASSGNAFPTTRSPRCRSSLTLSLGRRHARQREQALRQALRHGNGQEPR